MRVDLGLVDRVALVTGAGQGIGRQIALTLAAEGARLAVNDVDVARAESVAAEIRLKGGDAAPYVADVSDFGAVRSIFAAVEDRFGRLDVLVNNAGISLPDSADSPSSERWRRVMAVNLDGVYHCCSAAFEPMSRRGYGRIISIASYAAKRGGLLGGNVSYCTSKAAVMGLTVALAPEAAAHNITVNAVAPGFIDTELFRMHPPERRSMLAASAWLKRVGSVDDVADAVTFLASDRASFITGEILDVNGGLVLDL